ncbi:MAG: RNA-binding protein [Dehalococcoidia bacterium]|nr:RNA-binding protein [Dehalococcoidia bacterium]
MNIHVGNLAREATEEELKQTFAVFGEVTSVSIIRDRNSGDPKGFGFVEMPSSAEGKAAITGLKGKVLKERTLDVTEARTGAGNRSSGSHRDRKAGGSFGGRTSSFGGGQGRRKRR